MCLGVKDREKYISGFFFFISFFVLGNGLCCEITDRDWGKLLFLWEVFISLMWQGLVRIIICVLLTSGFSPVF